MTLERDFESDGAVAAFEKTGQKGHERDQHYPNEQEAGDIFPNFRMVSGRIDTKWKESDKLHQSLQAGRFGH